MGQKRERDTPQDGEESRRLLAALFFHLCLSVFICGSFSSRRINIVKMGKSTREAFGHALVQAGEQHKDIVVLDGDVHNSTYTGFFAKKFPERFFEVGIAESNLVGAASGLAASGKRAWVASFAAFVMCNAYDQLRMSVAFPALDVK